MDGVTGGRGGGLGFGLKGRDGRGCKEGITEAWKKARISRRGGWEGRKEGPDWGEEDGGKGGR